MVGGLRVVTVSNRLWLPYKEVYLLTISATVTFVRRINLGLSQASAAKYRRTEHFWPIMQGVVVPSNIRLGTNYLSQLQGGKSNKKITPALNRSSISYVPIKDTVRNWVYKLSTVE